MLVVRERRFTGTSPDHGRRCYRRAMAIDKNTRAARGLEALAQGRSIDIEYIDERAGYMRVRRAELPPPEQECGPWTDISNEDLTPRAFLHEGRVLKARWEAASAPLRAAAIRAARACAAIQHATYYMLQGPGGTEPDPVLHNTATQYLERVVRDFENTGADANGFERQFERFVFLARANDVVPELEDLLEHVKHNLEHVGEDDDTWVPGTFAKVIDVLKPMKAECLAELHEQMPRQLARLKGRTTPGTVAVAIVACAFGLSEDDVRTGCDDTGRTRPELLAVLRVRRGTAAVLSDDRACRAQALVQAVPQVHAEHTDAVAGRRSRARRIAAANSSAALICVLMVSAAGSSAR